MNATYTPDQQAQIDDAIHLAQKRQQESNGWVSYDWSDRLAERGSETFAVFGDTSYHLSLPPHIEDEGGAFDYLPVILDGRMFREYPDEGGARLLYLMRCTRRGKKSVDQPWIAAFLAVRWLHTPELKQSDAEIAEHIADEIDAGENALTRRLPGWA